MIDCIMILYFFLPFISSRYSLSALLLKAYLPEVKLSVDAACCAGVTPEKHLAALETLRSCQVEVR